MSLNIQNYEEVVLEKKEKLYEAKVLEFPKEEIINRSSKLKINDLGLWKLYDKSNVNEDGDQLRAVIGICFMFTMLVLIGLYSNFV